MVLLSSVFPVRRREKHKGDKKAFENKTEYDRDGTEQRERRFTKVKRPSLAKGTGDARANSRDSDSSNFIKLRLLFLKHRTAKYFLRWKNTFSRKGSFKNPVFKSRSEVSDRFSIYGYDEKDPSTELVSGKERFSRDSNRSPSVLLNDEWSTSPYAPRFRCESFKDRPGLQPFNAEDPLNVSVDWSKDSVFGYDSEQEEFYSAVSSGRASPLSEEQADSTLSTEFYSKKEGCLRNLPGCESGIRLFLESGYKSKDLLELGCSTKDLIEAGCDVKDLIEAGCTVKDLLASGCKVHDLLNVVAKRKLAAAGFSFQDLVLENSRIEELMAPDAAGQRELARRLQAGEELYPACDVSIWFRSCRQELLEALEGVTTGNIPTWLHGSLLRNGPGSLEVGKDRFQHLFDGSALIHGFEIKNGEVKYRCKFLQTNTYKKNQAAQRIVVTEFGTAGVPDPCQSIFQRVSVLFNPGDMSDNAMISIYPFGDELYAFSETTVIHRIDPLTLSTMERVNLSKHVNIVNHTSHPHVMEDGTVYNVGQTIKYNGPHYCIVKFPPPLNAGNNVHEITKSTFDQAQIVGSVPARWKLNPSYMHTFGITDNYFIIVEQPLSISFSTLISHHLKNKPMAPCLKWQNNEKTVIHLVNRTTGRPVTKYLADPFFFLHIINQYEDRDYIVLDICCYRDATMLDCMYIKSLQEANKNLNYCEMFRGRPLRFVLPLSARKKYDDWGTNLVRLPDSKATAYMFSDKTIFVCPELLCNLGCETPRIYYEKHLGKAYRYFYAISSDVDLENPGMLIKVDTLNKTSMTWCEEKIFPSEPVFIPSPNPKSEDDGVVLSALVWTKGMENKIGLLVLDAKTWTEIGRTVFTTPSPVPKCLHGWFTPYK